MKSVKRIFAILMCCVAALSMCIAGFAAGTNASSTASASEVKVGDTVTITVSIAETNVSSLGVDVAVPATFEIVSGEWIPDGPLHGFDTAKNKGAFAFASATKFSGEIFRLTLKAKTAGTAAQSVSIKVIAKNGATTVFTENTEASAKVTCSEHTFGEYAAAADKHERTCTVCGFTESAGHAFGDWAITKEPTCTAKGTETSTCTVCAYAENRGVATTEHKWDAGVVTKGPTCTENGEKTISCTGCKESKKEVLLATGHSFGSWANLDDTNHQRKCSKCDAAETKEHKFDAGKVTTEATCAKEGVITSGCLDCGATKTESVPKTEHTYTNDCDTSCNNCGATRTTSHRFETKWTHDEQGHWHKCSVCGLAKDKVVHSPSDWIVKTPASESQAGTQIKECTVCKRELAKESIPATGCKHEKGAMINGEKAATCTQDGYTGDEVCISCATVIKAGTAIPAKGHDIEVKNAKEATCKQDGYAGDEYCKTCGEAVKKGEVIPKLEHKPTVVGAKDATCTAEGFTGNMVCEVCNEVIKEGEAIPKLAHDYQDGVCKKCGAKDPNYVAPKKSNAGTIILICLGAALALGAIAAVVVIIIRRKRNDEDANN